MQADFLPRAGSYIALRRLQNRSDEWKTLCRTSECPQIFGVKKLSCESLIIVSGTVNARFGGLEACDSINFVDRKDFPGLGVYVLKV